MRPRESLSGVYQQCVFPIYYVEDLGINKPVLEPAFSLLIYWVRITCRARSVVTPWTFKPWLHVIPLVRSFLSGSSWRSFSLYQSIDIRFNRRRIMIPDLRWCSVISRRIRNDWVNYSRNLICYITLLVPAISISLMSWDKAPRRINSLIRRGAAS